jgi:NADH-quinone oxidoreductase subunit D
MTAREDLETDFTKWSIGPYHDGIPGPMRIHLTLDGEVIVRAETETGFVHRGLEKALELHAWQAAVSYADHLDPRASVFGELALCMAVEEIGQIEVPERARKIRLILSELTRISSHLSYLAEMARAVRTDTMMHYVLRDREKILDLFELLTGARFSLNFLRYGGVCADVTEGFIERVVEVCDLIRIRLKEYNDLFSFNHAFLKRSSSIGVLTPDVIGAHGITGPNARASGVAWDVRKAHSYCDYDKFDFHIPVGQGEGGAAGDAHDRYLVRLREISQSIDILKQATEAILPGEYCNGKIDKDFTILAGEAYARVESPKGLLGCHVVSDGGGKPSRIQFRTPSLSSLAAVPTLLYGAKLEDMPVILASLDISVAVVDR